MVDKNPWYNGNPHLPKANTKKEFTQELQEDYLRCLVDPIYFAEIHFKIVHQRRGLIKMDLYDYQREAIEKFQQKGKLIMSTARQVGKTTVATVVILWIALFNEHKNIAILANKEATAKEVLARIQLAYENLPDHLKGGVKEWNKKSIEFENGCKIFADATSGSSARGKSLFLLYIDECAHIENWEEFAASVLPTISASASDNENEVGEEAKLIFTSTPNGLNHFYYYHKDAEKVDSEWNLVVVPWWEVPGRGEKWKKKALSDLNNDEQKFLQEYCVEYLGSSGTLISGAALKLLTAAPKVYADDSLSIYKEPVEKNIYLLTADVSRGKKLDYSAFTVFNITKTPFEQVCTYRNNEINASDYAAVIDRIGRHYNYAAVLVEINDNGENVVNMLHQFHEYENLMQTETRGRQGKRVSATGGKKSDLGIRTTNTTRSAGCAALKMLVEQRKLIINDEETINELKTFSLKKTASGALPNTIRYEAETGKHDDLVMGLVIFAWLSVQDYFKLLTDNDTLKDLKEWSEEELEQYMLPFGIINDGLQDIQQPFETVIDMSDDDFSQWMRN